MRTEPEEPTRTPSIGGSSSEPYYSATNPQDAAYEWTWEPPDLTEDSPFYRERVTSLKAAIVEAAPAGKEKKWLGDGLEALRIHRGNYSEEGPQRLQLLWWKFPREHWEGLQEGSHRSL
jgi:hypothetical protein